ncbi:MAG: hypothetical protein C0596_13865 [Marinilabiliales bacterium]|nr:MAG: hypothetical protein C0596_13865 [Marinilabiliales bacterium]
MIKKIITLFVAISVAATVFAQGRVGSPYTRYGIGDITRSTLIRNNSMGGLSYTLPYNNGINHINPACVADIDTMTFIFDFGLNGGARIYSIEDPAFSQTKSDFHLSHLNFGFAVTKWWKAAAGVQPYSDVGYSISANDTLLNVDKNYLFAGDGGVNKVFISNAFKPFENFTFGVTASYLFGKIYQSGGIAFDDESGDYINVFEQNIIQVNDFTFDAGLKYRFSINDNNHFTIGGVYGYNSNLDAKRSSIVYHTLTTSSAIVDTVFQSDEELGIVGLPQTIGIGLGYQHSDKFFIGFDYTMQDWTGAAFFGNVDNLSNGQFFSLGT